MTIPGKPRIFHITHVDNLQRIVADAVLWSDAMMIERGGPAAAIGMNRIKERRLDELRVKCYPDNFVGEYVPFHFCPRSIMLYLFHRDNNPELTYHGGQEPIVHLGADLMEVLAWADNQERRWAFSLSNAGARYAEFRGSLDELDEVDWDAVANNDFRSADVKEGKQAEFLMYEMFPWSLIECVGVHSEAVRAQVTEILDGVEHSPSVAIRPDWYY